MASSLARPTTLPTAPDPPPRVGVRNAEDVAFFRALQQALEHGRVRKQTTTPSGAHASAAKRDDENREEDFFHALQQALYSPPPVLAPPEILPAAWPDPGHRQPRDNDDFFSSLQTALRAPPLQRPVSTVVSPPTSAPSYRRTEPIVYLHVAAARDSVEQHAPFPGDTASLGREIQVPATGMMRLAKMVLGDQPTVLGETQTRLMLAATVGIEVATFYLPAATVRALLPPAVAELVAPAAATVIRVVVPVVVRLVATTPLMLREMRAHGWRAGVDISRHVLGQALVFSVSAVTSKALGQLVSTQFGLWDALSAANTSGLAGWSWNQNLWLSGLAVRWVGEVQINNFFLGQLHLRTPPQALAHWYAGTPSRPPPAMSFGVGGQPPSVADRAAPASPPPDHRRPLRTAPAPSVGRPLPADAAQRLALERAEHTLRVRWVRAVPESVRTASAVTAVVGASVATYAVAPWLFSTAALQYLTTLDWVRKVPQQYLQIRGGEILGRTVRHVRSQYDQPLRDAVDRWMGRQRMRAVVEKASIRLAGGDASWRTLPDSKRKEVRRSAEQAVRLQLWMYTAAKWSVEQMAAAYLKVALKQMAARAAKWSTTATPYVAPPAPPAPPSAAADLNPPSAAAAVLSLDERGRDALAQVWGPPQQQAVASLQQLQTVATAHAVEADRWQLQANHATLHPMLSVSPVASEWAARAEEARTAAAESRAAFDAQFEKVHALQQEAIGGLEQRLGGPETVMQFGALGDAQAQLLRPLYHIEINMPSAPSVSPVLTDEALSAQIRPHLDALRDAQRTLDTSARTHQTLVEGRDALQAQWNRLSTKIERATPENVPVLQQKQAQIGEQVRAHDGALAQTATRVADAMAVRDEVRFRAQNAIMDEVGFDRLFGTGGAATAARLGMVAEVRDLFYVPDPVVRLSEPSVAPHQPAPQVAEPTTLSSQQVAQHALDESMRQNYYAVKDAVRLLEHHPAFQRQVAYEQTGAYRVLGDADFRTWGLAYAWGAGPVASAAGRALGAALPVVSETPLPGMAARYLAEVATKAGVRYGPAGVQAATTGTLGGPALDQAERAAALTRLLGVAALPYASEQGHVGQAARAMLDLNTLVTEAVRDGRTVQDAVQKALRVHQLERDEGWTSFSFKSLVMQAVLGEASLGQLLGQVALGERVGRTVASATGLDRVEGASVAAAAMRVAGGGGEPEGQPDTSAVGAAAPDDVLDRGVAPDDEILENAATSWVEMRND